MKYLIISLILFAAPQLFSQSKQNSAYKISGISINGEPFSDLDANIIFSLEQKKIELTGGQSATITIKSFDTEEGYFVFSCVDPFNRECTISCMPTEEKGVFVITVVYSKEDFFIYFAEHVVSC